MYVTGNGILSPKNQPKQSSTLHSVESHPELIKERESSVSPRALDTYLYLIRHYLCLSTFRIVNVLRAGVLTYRIVSTLCIISIFQVKKLYRKKYTKNIADRRI